MVKFFIFLLGIIYLVPAISQQSEPYSPLIGVKLYVDTLSFSWEKDAIQVNKREVLPFKYDEEQEVVEGYLFFDLDADIEMLRLMPSADFDIVDSVALFDDYARFKVRFRQISASGFLKFIFEQRSATGIQLLEVGLFPYTDTYVNFYPGDMELFVGEEKRLELITNNPENLVVDSRWSEGLPINYRLTKAGSRIFLELSPTSLGNQMLTVPIRLKRPFIEAGVLNYALPTLEYSFMVRGGRLAFLSLDPQELTPSDDRTQPIEVQIQNDRNLKLGRTYRLENQEDKGGALIAELFTKTYLNNDKVLCLIRPYAYHRKNEGYLYLKYADQPQFVTNVDITPKTEIKKIAVQREGQDWKYTNEVYPGETIVIKLEGVSFHKAHFTFPGIENLKLDSLVRNETASLFKVKIPEDIAATKIEIYNGGNTTGWELRVKEYQRPRAFDFIKLELDSEVYSLESIDKPIYYEGNLADLLISFDRARIDEGGFYGKQYLDIKVKVSSKAGNLIELYQFDDLLITPDESSVRHVHYTDPNSLSNGLNLNNYLSKKTYNLEEWSRIDLEFSHVKSHYTSGTKTHKIQIYLKRDYNFDIDVSFPGGLLILKPGGNFTNFGGISFAMIGQFSFYQPGKIAKNRPYKIGAGFIAIDAFNFTESNNGDVGLVVIGSLFPTNSDKRLTFPLYAGFGYLMKEVKPFFMIGPGIRVRL